MSLSYGGADGLTGSARGLSSGVNARFTGFLSAGYHFHLHRLCAIYADRYRHKRDHYFPLPDGDV
jgi:hypothetical protein